MKKLLSVLLMLSLVMSFAPYARAEETEETVAVPVAVEVNGKTIITITPGPDSPAYPVPTLPVDTSAFLSFNFSEPGEYSYTIKQVGEDPAIYYDDTEYLVQFYLERNDAGQLEGTVSIHKTGSEYKDLTIVFENMAIAPITDDPPVEKLVTGNPDTPASFQFTMEALTADAPMPAGSSEGTKTVSINGPGEVEFGTITFTQAGTYEYTVREVAGTEEGYTYDAAVYTLRYVITEEEGVLSKSRTILKDGTETDEMKAVFENVYTKTEEETTTVPPATTAPTPPPTGDNFWGGWFIIFGAAVLSLTVFLILAGKKRGKDDPQD